MKRSDAELIREIRSAAEECFRGWWWPKPQEESDVKSKILSAEVTRLLDLLERNRQQIADIVIRYLDREERQDWLMRRVSVTDHGWEMVVRENNNALVRALSAAFHEGAEEREACDRLLRDLEARAAADVRAAAEKALAIWSLGSTEKKLRTGIAMIDAFDDKLPRSFAQAIRIANDQELCGDREWMDRFNKQTVAIKRAEILISADDSKPDFLIRAPIAGPVREILASRLAALSAKRQ